MTNLPGVLAWGALGVLVLIASRYLLVMLNLRRLRFAPVVAADYIGLDEVPDAQRRLLDLAAPRLREFGFTPVHALRSPITLVAHPPALQYADAWLHESSGAWAVVALRDEPDYGNLYAVSFYTFYAHARHLYTTARRGHEQIAVHPAVDHLDTAQDLAQQWQAHVQRMAERGADEVLRDRAALEAIERRMPGEARAAACAAGMLVALPDGTAQFTWRGAWKLWRAYQRGVHMLLQQPLGPLLANGVDPADPQAVALRASADAIAIGNALAARRHDLGRRNKGFLLLATGLVSLLLFGWQFDWLFALVLVAVLLLHELGHLLAMHWAGYRDLQVFFVPLFGAVASGRDERVPAWKKMLVLLAGPVPGLVLGCGLLAGLVAHALPPQAWLFLSTSILLTVNLFNLLPFMPLDGGRLLDLLLLARLPRCRGVFAALGALALVAAGLFFGTPLMVVLGGILLLTVPAQFRQARMLVALRGVQGETLDQEGQWLVTLSRLLAAPPLGKLRYAQRFAVAQSIAQSGTTPSAPAVVVVCGLLLYSVSLLLPVWMLAEHGVDIAGAAGGAFVRQTASPARRDYVRELSAARSDEARFKLLFAAAAEAEDEEDFATAHGYYQRASDLAGQHANYQAQRVQAVIGVARTGEDGKTAGVLLAGLLKSLVGEDRATRLQRAEVLSELSLDFSPQSNALNLARMEEVVTLRAALLAADDATLLEARRALAWRLWQAERADEAVTQLRARADALAVVTCDDECAARAAWMRHAVYADLGWLLLARGQGAVAAHLAQDYPALRVMPAKPLYAIDDTLPVLDAWISHVNGDHAAAIAALSALLATKDLQHSLFAELQWLIDLACFAEQAGDSAAAAAWTDKLRERVQALRAQAPHLSLAWLGRTRDTPFSWSRLRTEQEVAWLTAHAPALLNGGP